MAIVCVGAWSVGICLLLSEILYPEVDRLFDCPAWYQTFFYLSLAVSVGGLVGCGFTKDCHNTKNAELNLELILFAFGFFGMLVLALSRSESQTKDIFIGIGGAICSVGLFCGIGSFIGKCKKPKRGQVYARLYMELLRRGAVSQKNLPEKGAELLRIKETESYFNAPLPPDLVDFLLEFDGDGELLFSAEEIVGTTKDIREAYKNTDFHAYDYDRYCFFGRDERGNCFCYRICDDGSFEDREIYVWDRETTETKVVATALQDLITRYYGRK